MLKKVHIFTDGSCLGNPGPGGWAAILRYENYEKTISGSEKNTTNNRMELIAIIKALELLKEKCEITIISDSQYLIKAIKDGWLEKWKTNGWKTADKKTVKNQDLWQALDNLLSKHQITWQWVKGHADNPDNLRVDKIANDAAKMQKTQL